MAKKRVLELAKELKVEVADVQRAALSSNVAASGPASMLDEDDVAKIKAAIQSGSASSAGTKTLTLNRPIVAGQPRQGNVEGRGRTVEVAVRRRRPARAPGSESQVTPATPTPAPTPEVVSAPVVNEAPVTPAPVAAAPAAPAKPKPTPATKPAAPEARKEPPAAAKKTPARSTLSPAQRAAQAVEAAKVAKAEQQRTSQQQQQQARADRPRRPNQRPQNRPTPAGMSDRPQGQNQQGNKQSSGPRTTIRSGLTPAQIAAKRAPSSSLKEIEERISKDRSDRRAQGNRPQRPAGAPGAGGAPGGPRRSPSVAVAPQTDIPGGAGDLNKKKKGPGGPTRLSQRRLTPAEKAARRNYSAKRHELLSDEQVERMSRLAKGDRRRHQGITKDDAEFVVREVEITDPIVVSELASRMAIKSGMVIKKLLEMGMPTTANESIDADTALLIVEEFGHKPKIINEAAVEDVLTIDETEENPDDQTPRPPVVVVMGHVDHGKTSILDALRKANVASGEAGGITQHIGAYMVKLESGARVVFIDTPGHEAFTGLRARGAKLTDVAVLVVAADDGVKPQTVEALNHAKAAGVPIIVAVNKMDKEGADPEMVKRQLAEHEVIPEDWGGQTIFVNVSAKTGEGLDDLLEMLALQTEVLELKATPTRRGQGIIIESRLDRGRGPVATVLVQNGTFHQGDIVVVGTVTGRIRAIVDENNVQHRTAGPSIPFELLGLEEVPEAGHEIVVVENDRQARDIISYRKEKIRQLGVQQHKRASLDELFEAVQSGVAEVPVVIKGDVTGSVEAMAESLVKAGTDEVKVKIVHKGIGGITESDVMLASAANAIVIGFNVRPETKGKKLAEAEGVDVRFYKVIYDAIDDIRAAMAGKLSPDKVEKVIGTAEVRDTFSVPKVGTIAGCYVTDGNVVRNAKVRVLRESVLIYDGELDSLKRFKDDVREVKTGYECGIGVKNFNDVKVGDSFEFYIIEEVAATL